ncbi:hypothetical protein T459_04102 [Capsicum annuum]|uniref:DUF223 domain-containing protein n=1 Tax=Capsicum annuum TaxID=4072 RepID=A0A2G3A425_CAPAN|nr:hypothetical protein T459_04102 [Capsicum annuum]
MIRVRICRMWDAINSRKNGELISLDMIFVDEKWLKVVVLYIPIENSLKIIFFPSTAIKSLSKDIVDIPMNGFHFIKSELIKSKVNNNMILSDLNELSYSCFSFPEDLGDKFAPYFHKKDSGPYIVIVTSTTLKEFRDKVSFSTTYASKVYVNLDIDYIRSLKQKFTTMSTGVQVIKSSNINSIPIEEEMFMNRMNIKNLLESD